MHPDPIPVPLRDRHGQTIAYAVLDIEDAPLTAYRWYLDSDPRRDSGKLYARTIADGVTLFLHRLVAGLPSGDPRVVDHINGLGLDNRRANLRVVTHAQNAQNRRKRSATSSRYRGVTWDKARGQWLAQGAINGRNHHIGRFADEHKAGKAAAAWRAEHMPYSADATFPPNSPAGGVA